MRDPATPYLSDHPLPDVTVDREVDVQPVPARMPLRRPRIREPLPAKLTPQPTEELAHVLPNLHRIEATLPGIGQRRQPIQPVRRAVATQLRPRPPRCLQPRALDVRRTTACRQRPNRAHETTPALARLGIEVERPICGLHRHHLRVTLDSKAPGWVAAPPSRPLSRD